jgi:hypothetical protein
MPVSPPSPPLDLRGLSRMTDFVSHVNAPASEEPEKLSARLKLSARKLARGLTTSLFKRGFVKGVSERWDEAHLQRTASTPGKLYSGFEPRTSPDKRVPGLSIPEPDDDFTSPERVGPLSFERRKRNIEEFIQNL